MILTRGFPNLPSSLKSNIISIYALCDTRSSDLGTSLLAVYYTEAKVDVTQEIEQRAQQAAQAGADHCALCSISGVTSTLASLYVFLT